MDKGSTTSARRQSTIIPQSALSALVPIQEASQAQEDPAIMIALHSQINQLETSVAQLTEENKTMKEEKEVSRVAAGNIDDEQREVEA